MVPTSSFLSTVCGKMMCSSQKKKVNGPEGVKYFFPVERGNFFGTIVLWSGFFHMNTTLAKRFVSLFEHYYKGEIMCRSQAINFLFLITVGPIIMLNINHNDSFDVISGKPYFLYTSH